MDSPPEIMYGTVLVDWAIVDSSVEFTGALTLFVDGALLGAVPALAIVRDRESDGLLLVHCDADWNVLGVQAWNAPDAPPVDTVEAVKEKAETYYAGIASRWAANDA